MTLLVGFGNGKHCVLLADRRITNGSAIVDDEFNKLTVLACHDARVTLAFTGLASLGTFKMSDWIVNTLWQINQTGVFTLLDTLDALRQELEKLFAGFSYAHRLTVLVCGFTYWDEAPRPCLFKISNFDPEPFSAAKFVLTIGSPSPDGFVEIAGMTQSVPLATTERLLALLASGAPRPSLVRYATLHLQRAARDGFASGSIGERCNAAVIQAECDSAITSTYHTPRKAHRAYGCNVLVFGHSMFMGPDIIAAQALASGESRKKDPCWCGSGKTYRECHLKKYGAVEVRHGLWKHPLHWVIDIEFQTPVASGKRFWVLSDYA
jgi:hypothetical protein